MKRLPATTVYLALSAASSLFNYLVFTVSAVYRVDVANLNPLQLVLVGTVLEATIFLGEIPTGVLADVYSRRLSIICGTFLIGVAFVLEGCSPYFSVILVAQMIWGIGYTFVSGAEQAWIADEVDGDAAQQVYLAGAQVSQLGGLFGTLLSVGLASFRLGAPLVVGGCLYIGLGIFLLLFMPERGFSPKFQSSVSAWQTMAQTLRSGVQLVQRQPVLIQILRIGAFHGLASEGLDRLWEMHFLENFTFPDLGRFEPIVWFGIINAIANLLNIAGVEIVRRWLIFDHPMAAARILFAIDSLFIISLMTFSMAHSFELALAACWATDLLRATNEPVYNAWLNQKLESATRATVFSISSQVNAIGQIMGGPVAGVVGNLVSVRAAIATSGLILAPVILLYLQTLRQNDERLRR